MSIYAGSLGYHSDFNVSGQDMPAYCIYMSCLEPFSVDFCEGGITSDSGRSDVCFCGCVLI